MKVEVRSLTKLILRLLVQDLKLSKLCHEEILVEAKPAWQIAAKLQYPLLSYTFDRGYSAEVMACQVQLIC